MYHPRRGTAGEELGGINPSRPNLVTALCCTGGGLTLHLKANQRHAACHHDSLHNLTRRQQVGRAVCTLEATASCS
jgi:hypothetical protein